MSILDTLLGSLNGTSLLDSLLGDLDLLNDLPGDLGDTLDEATGGLNLTEGALSDLIDSLNSGGDVDGIVTPLQDLIDSLETLVGQISGIDTSSVNALEDAINGLIEDFDLLNDAIDNGLTTEDAIAALEPIWGALGTLTDPLETVLGSDGLFGNELESLVGDTPLLNELVSELGDFGDDVGQALEPILGDFLDTVDRLPDTISSPETLASELTGLADDLQGVIDSLGSNPSAAVNDLIDALQDLIDDLGVTVTDITDGSVPLVNELAKLLNPAVDDLQTLTKKLTDDITDSDMNTVDGTADKDWAETTAKQDMFDMKGGNDTVVSMMDHLGQVDSIWGGEGIDTLILKKGSKNDKLKLRVATEKTPENARSGLPDGTVIGEFEIFDTRKFAGRAIVLGDTADDVMMGGKGADKFVGKDGNDSMDGGKGKGKDRLLGGNGDDKLVGMKGDDLLNGGDGDDMLHGGRGKDKLKTGKGKDEIVFESIKERGDRVADFDPKQDTLLFNRKGFSKSLKKGKLKDSQFVLGSKAESKGACFMYDQDKGSLFFDANGVERGKSSLIAEFKGNTALSASDIVMF